MSPPASSSPSEQPIAKTGMDNTDQLPDQPPQTSKFNRFLVPVQPTSISAHPDHPLFPSFKLLPPQFMAEKAHQLPPSSISPRQSLSDQASPVDADAGDQICLNIRRAWHFLGPSPSRVAVRKRQAIRSRKKLSSASSSHTTSSRPRFSMPSPPHPAANYIPFPEPIAIPARKASPDEIERTPSESTEETQEEDADSQAQASGLSSRFEHRDMAEPCTPQEAMAKASTTAVPWPCPPIGPLVVQPVEGVHSSSVYEYNAQVVAERGSMEQPMPWLSWQDGFGRAATDGLPFGHANPSIIMLNTSPFVDHVRRILTVAGIHDSATLNAQSLDIEERYEPVWQQAYLRIGGHRYAYAISIKPQALPTGLLAWQQAPDEGRLGDYAQAFLKYIQPIYPVVPSGRFGSLVVDFLQHCQAAGPGQAAAAYAIELLVFALGSVCWAKYGGTIVEPGPEFYARAKGLLEEVSTAAQSLDVARAHLLAALFCGQLAWIPEAADHVQEASTVVLHLIHQPCSSGVDVRPLVEHSRHPHALADGERQLVLLYWTCVLLEFEINTETGREPSMLLRYQSAIPPPEFGAPANQGGGVAEHAWVPEAAADELDVQTNFLAQVCLRRCLNGIYAEVYEARPQASERSAVEELRQQFAGVSLSQLSQGPRLPGAHKSILTARARAGYWEGQVWGFLPRLLRADGQPSADELAAGVCSLVEVIRAYHGTADRFIVPNAFGAAMMQCRYLLLLFSAASTMPAVAEIADPAVLDELIEGTAACLQNMAGAPGVLEAAKRVLCVMREQLPPALGSRETSLAVEAAAIPASFARAANLTVVTAGAGYEGSSVLPTATTSSFTSTALSTPNTQCWSAGAFPSPFSSSMSSLSSPLESPYSSVEQQQQVPPQPRSHISCLWPPVAIQSVPEAPSCLVDVFGFSCQLGLADPLGSVGSFGGLRDAP